MERRRGLAAQAVGHGYAALAPDVRGFWEMARPGEQTRTSNSCANLQRQALMFGRTLIGERVHDMGRLIDYALTRPEIDAARLIITGNSGGGSKVPEYMLPGSLVPKALLNCLALRKLLRR